MKNLFINPARLAASFIFSLTSLGIMQAKAQFLGGFFSQQATKKKLMTEQIAGYQLYLSAIKTGYAIVGNGLTAAHDLKNGTFSLHTAYFNALQQVAPVVKNDPKGRATDSLYQQIRSLFSNEKQWQAKQKSLTVTELQYLDKVSAGLLAECKTDMAELKDVLTPGRLQLSDAERLNRLDRLYDRMKDKQAFAAYFSNKCRKLALNRQKQQKDQEQMKKLYGIQ
ncbi:hypothetical protein [Mucilaginibacter gossypii]|uniref:TerB family tellurite resistance protein n=1 Tax=Mucilaginibacter gossypii TaxID=551996 RepID=A0A1G8NL78_9SPHI|nr:hypothetical protein [Mucilaginibacter gossypii]SDI80928.1 hypothetical protein SAMN05192573_13416 [Mucilaginibacter gossypii]